ncbi:MAG: 16S rRNA (cytosine(1402)-N(4))-methyltransferase RsmH [Ahrensia sp.]|nr:16S rRNA (cytosine(1402)-N(4))-methyltransferase RsmH [Ahrensia sp.]
MTSSANADAEIEGHSQVPLKHVPVMLGEVLHAAQLREGDRVIDATFGAGGYSKAFLGAEVEVLAIDRDPQAIADGQKLVERAKGRLTLIQGRFSQLADITAEHGWSQVDAVVADIGVSSMQIDQAERGFSFMKDGPLDMRMSQAGPNAADVVNTLPRSDLTRIIGILGEEKQASRISAEIVEWRDRQPFVTTQELARCIEKVLGRKHSDRTHPATRTFQALRIFVNGELEELAHALLACERVLKPGGRLVVVSFHSLEDRMVKAFLTDRSSVARGSRHMPQAEAPPPTFTLVKRGAQSASAQEIENNVRARSAKLRFGVRSDVPARPADLSVFKLPRLAQLQPSSRGVL